MEKYLVDTTVFISHLRGFQPAIDYLSSNRELVMSYITVAELVQGIRNKRDLGIVQKLIKGFDVIYGSTLVNQIATDLLQRYYLQHGMQFLDALQAGIAITNKFTLITDNIKHFHFIPELLVISFEEALEV